MQETGENFSSVDQCPRRDLRGRCRHKNRRLPAPPGSCLPHAHSGHSHWFKQQASLILTQPSPEARAGQGTQPLLGWTLPNFPDLIYSVEEYGLMQGNSHITQLRRRNELQTVHRIGSQFC